jgi:hypothetical protein
MGDFKYGIEEKYFVIDRRTPLQYGTFAEGNDDIEIASRTGGPAFSAADAVVENAAMTIKAWSLM